MSKALSFVKLDYITVKPYFTVKNLFFFLIISFFTSEASTAIGIMMAFATIYVSYPFVAGEKSNIDILYATLAIKRNTVVLGRYLFALSFDILGAAFAVFASFLMSLLRGGEFNLNDSFTAAVIVFALFSVLQAIQLPLYFKLGYTKAKLLVYLPLIAMPLGILLLSENLPQLVSYERLISFIEWVAANPGYTTAFGAAVWLMVILFSYGAAIKYYGKRDF